MALDSVDKFPCVTVPFFPWKLGCQHTSGQKCVFHSIIIGDISSFHDWDVQLFSGSHEQPISAFCTTWNKAMMGLCLQSADSRESCILHFELGWAIQAQYCVSVVSPCKAEHCFHNALPLLLSCPHECFDRTRKRLLGFLEDRVWLGDWEWCYLECERHFCCWSPGMQESKPSIAAVYTWGVWLWLAICHMA